MPGSAQARAQSCHITSAGSLAGDKLAARSPCDCRDLYSRRDEIRRLTVAGCLKREWASWWLARMDGVDDAAAGCVSLLDKHYNSHYDIYSCTQNNLLCQCEKI